MLGKEPACQCRRLKRHRFDPWVRKIPWRMRAWGWGLETAPAVSSRWQGRHSVISFPPVVQRLLIKQ